MITEVVANYYQCPSQELQVFESVRRPDGVAVYGMERTRANGQKAYIAACISEQGQGTIHGYSIDDLDTLNTTDFLIHGYMPDPSDYLRSASPLTIFTKILQARLHMSEKEMQAFLSSTPLPS